MIALSDVEHVAKLARLALSEDEKQRFTMQLGAIIDHFKELQAIDTTGVEPLAHALPVTNVMRADLVVQPPGSATLLANAPAAENGFFRVPRIGE